MERDGEKTVTGLLRCDALNVAGTSEVWVRLRRLIRQFDKKIDETVLESLYIKDEIGPSLSWLF